MYSTYAPDYGSSFPLLSDNRVGTPRLCRVALTLSFGWRINLKEYDMSNLTAAQATRVVAALEKSLTLPAKIERAKAFGIVINATINGQNLKSLAGEKQAMEIACRVLDKLGIERQGVNVQVKL